MLFCGGLERRGHGAIRRPWPSSRRDAELARYQKIYFATWPDGPARLSWTGITYFVVRPTWIRYSDFDQSPPLIEEFKFEGVC